ncbi:MAG: hypothetical protein RLZ37_316 [Actinomycetota bacterium]|jgi:hypothetical protein
MSRRIDIELTSSRPDGSWTWRAAGAREPKGVLDSDILPQGSKAGDVLKVEAEFDIDGITIMSVVQGRQKVEKVERISIVGADRPFEPVTQQLARKPKGDRPDKGDRRRPRPEGAQRERSGDRGPRRPRFEAPPELPKRPRAKRLRPSNEHRRIVLEELPSDQRPIAELALQGMQTVRQRLKEANARLAEEGKPTMPEQSVLQMAENLLPRLRVADWLDRAHAAVKEPQLDLKDLRSVVAAANDPLIERAEQCRELVTKLREVLAQRADQEYKNWLEDIDAAVGVGRIVRALKLAGQPPKAGAIFPEDLGRRLAEATSANLVSDALADRWIAVLEAAAFAPIRSLIKVVSKPASLSPELVKTVERLAGLLPQVAQDLGVEVSKPNLAPKPLRPVRPSTKKLPPKPPTPGAAQPAPASTTAIADEVSNGVTASTQDVVPATEGDTVTEA